jgi:hypothetical protein
VARTLTGAGTAIALIGMVTAFQFSAAVAADQAEADAQTQAAVAAEAAATDVRGQAVRVLDASLLPEVVIAPPVTIAPVRSAAAAPAAPAAPAAAAPADGSTGGSGG